MPRGVRWIVFDNFFEFSFSTGPVPIVIEPGVGERSMGFHQRRVNFERLQSGYFSFGKGISGIGVSVIAENVIGVGETYIWERIAGVFLDSRFERTRCLSSLRPRFVYSSRIGRGGSLGMPVR